MGKPYSSNGPNALFRQIILVSQGAFIYTASGLAENNFTNLVSSSDSTSVVAVIRADVTRTKPSAGSSVIGKIRGQQFATLLALFTLTVVMTGCRTYSQQNKFAEPWLGGDLAKAEKEATRKADKESDGKDAIVWRLEQAAILRTQGKYEESNKAFDEAQALIDRYAEQAKVKLGAETGALFSNLANLPYRGRSYDGIMLNTYKALNFLAMREPDKARVEIIRAFQRQQDAVGENKRRIEQAQQELEAEKQKQRIKKAEADTGFKSKVSQSYSALDGIKVYADYVNPFTVYLEGLIFFANADGPSDLERARKSFERVASFAEDNRFVKADLEMVEAAVRGEPVPPTTYVIFETGRAPMRDQVRIDIPLFFTRLSYLGAAFPTLEIQGGHLPALQVLAGGTNVTTEPLASIDSVIALDFKNELPTVITKTIASTVVKAAAGYAANEAANQQGGELAGLLSQISTAVYQLAVNISDLRTWTTLPKEFQICRIPTPADRKIELQSPGGAQKVSVALDEGVLNLVYVKSIAANGPMFVSQMKLK